MRLSTQIGADYASNLPESGILWRSSGFTGSPDRCQPFLQRPARSFRKGLAEIGRPFRRAAWPCATTSASEKFSRRLPCSFLFIVEEIILRQMRSHRGGYTRSKMASELKSTPTQTASHKPSWGLGGKLGPFYSACDRGRCADSRAERDWPNSAIGGGFEPPDARPADCRAALSSRVRPRPETAV